jgi:hypothetical protein
MRDDRAGRWRDLRGEASMTKSYNSPDAPLTAKQLRFVAEYRVDGNGKRAAIRAGYS